MQTLAASVGRDGENRYADVVFVQFLLNKFDIPGELVPLVVDGDAGQKTVRRIEAFQKHLVMLNSPDGRVDPGGRSFQKLISARSGAAPATDFDISAQAVELLQSIEELATRPYDDQTGEDIDHWVKGATIGYGHLILRDEWGHYRDGISEAQAVALFHEDLQPFVAQVRRLVTVDVTQNEFDAVVIFIFNIGATAFAQSSVLKLINDPAASTSYPNLEQAWKAWNKSQGRVSRGLQNRRQAEWGIFANNVYQKW